MANLLHFQLSSSSSSILAGFRRRYYSLNCEIDLWPSIVIRDSFECRASRGGRFRFRTEEEELFREGGFEFGNRKKKKKPWWLDDDDDDDDFDNWMNDEQDWTMVFEVFRTLSWMLAPIGISLLLGTDSNAGLMALAVPLVQSLFSLVVDKVFSRPSIRPVKSSRRGTFSSSARRRKGIKEDDMSGGSVDKGGYKSWMVGDDADSSSTSSRYGGWDDLDKRKEIRFESASDENVRSDQQFERKASRRWRVKEKPLILRMLFATFPFLSSWTKLLF